jgi:uncharacterized protein YukJ
VRCSFASPAAKTVALFVRFSVQSTATDDRGNPS